MNKRSLLVWVAVLLVLSLACSSLGGGDGGGSSSAGGVDITVTNRTPDEICYVYISPSSSDQWGADQLGDEETIADGASRRFSMDDDTYDLLAENCDEITVATAWEISDDTTVTVGDRGADTRLLIENESNTDVCYVLISPTTADEWGEDRLGDMEQLVTGDRRLFYVEGGVYDLQVADCDGEPLTEEYEVDLTEDLTWTLYDE